MSEPRVCPECGTKTDALSCPKDGRPTIEESKLRRKDPLLGMVIEGKYRVEEKLGAGGFGAVYRAAHTETGGSVCIKLLHANLCSDEQAVRRFYIEAQNTHKLHHPNTVRVSDFGQTEQGVLFLAMELVGGKPLSKVIKEEKRLSPGRAVRIVSQLLKSLAEAHGHGIVHRDVKPQNIMLIDQIGEPDFVKVLDFGISKAVDSTGASTKGSIGTPRYMAPEQWRNDAVDARADLYSVGCILYQLLAGRTPFVVKGTGTEQALAFMAAHIKDPPDPLLEVAPGVCPEPLADLVMQLLEKRREDRPESAEVVLRTLANIRRTYGLSEEVSTVAPLPAPEPDPTMLLPDRRPANPAVGDDATFARAANTETGTVLAEEPVSRGRGLVWGGVGVAAAVALFAVGAWVFSSNSEESSGSQATSVGIAEAAPEQARKDEPTSSPAPEMAIAESEAPAETGSNTRAEAAPEARAAAVETPPPPATLVLLSEPPGAEVFDAQAKSLGQTPLTLHSPPSPREAEFVLRLAGHRSAKMPAAFPAAGETTKTPVELEELPTLRLESKPTGASVAVKAGEKLGTTPYAWTVPEAALEKLEAGEDVVLVFELDGRKAVEKPVSAALLEGGEALAVTLGPAHRRDGKVRQPAKRKPPQKPNSTRRKTGGWTL